MSGFYDGPSSHLFETLSFEGTTAPGDLALEGVSEQMAAALGDMPRGPGVAWGIPFEVGNVVMLVDRPVAIETRPTRAQWFVFMHTSDARPVQVGADGFVAE